MGFAEIFVIAIVGLIVIGPDKLPQTIKTCLIWFGRIKRLVSETRSEFEQQLGVDEIRREIHNEEVMASLKALKVAKDDALAGVEGYAESARKEIKNISDSENFHDFDPDDEGLFGEQHANHPPDPEEDDKDNARSDNALSQNPITQAARSAKTQQGDAATQATPPIKSQGAKTDSDSATKQ